MVGLSRSSIVSMPLVIWVMTLLMWLAICAAQATEIRGRVVSVTDGDTVTVLDAQRVQHRVRLQGIDAPERRQPFSRQARMYLSDLVLKREVVVWVDKVDRYKRPVGVVYVDGMDTGLQMVQAGLAWHYKQYQREQTPQERQAYAQAEDEARRARLGLWSDPTPVPPWDFRRAQRQ